MKKQFQLGMNPSTAQYRLIKDILWKLIIQTNQNICCKCNEEMTRETFSIEHIVPWLDSDDPVKLFFDLENISFSHLKCNVGSARQSRKLKDKCGTIPKYRSGCRCEQCKKVKSLQYEKYYSTEKRKERYLKNGN